MSDCHPKWIWCTYRPNSLFLLPVVAPTKRSLGFPNLATLTSLQIHTTMRCSPHHWRDNRKPPVCLLAWLQRTCKKTANINTIEHLVGRCSRPENKHLGISQLVCHIPSASTKQPPIKGTDLAFGQNVIWTNSLRKFDCLICWLIASQLSFFLIFSTFVQNSLTIEHVLPWWLRRAFHASLI